MITAESWTFLRQLPVAAISLFFVGLLPGDAAATGAAFTLDLESALLEPSGELGLGDLAVEAGWQADLSRPESPISPDPSVRIPKLHRRIVSDLSDLVRAPIRTKGKQWRKVALGAAAVGALSLVDEEIRDFVQRSSAGDDLATTIRPLATESSVALVGLGWIAGGAFDKPGLQATSSDALEAMVVSGLLTVVIKRATGRDRPYGSGDSTSFGGSGTSMSSGETATAFAIASVIARHSRRWWCDALAWTYASLIGWQRIQLDEHWASDVLAGALIGTAVGRWVVKRNRGTGEARWAVAPTLSSREYGVSAHVRF